MQLFKIKENGKAGFIDATGRVVIEPRFENANDFAEGLAWASIEMGSKTLSGFIDPSGDWAIEPRFFGFEKSVFEGSYYFHDGRSLIYTEDNRPAYIDREGTIVSSTDYEQVYPFAEERALVVRDGLWGFIDPAGDEVIPFRYSAERLGPMSVWRNRFSEGLALVPFGADDYEPNLGFIDREGTVVLKEQFTGGTAFSEGLAMVRDRASMTDFFFLDRDDYLAFDRMSPELTRFSEGLADMWDEDRELIGYVDKSGEWAIPPKFSQTAAFAEGLACVQIRGRKKAGYINKQGAIAIAPRFDGALAFKDGLAAVVEKDRRGYIDPTGEYVWRAK